MGIILVVLCAPETKFSRSPMAMNGVVVYTDEFGVTHMLTDEEAIQRFGQVQGNSQSDQQKRSFISRLNPFDGVSPNAFKTWLGAYLKIAQSCTSPGVVFATLASSISLGRIPGFVRHHSGANVGWNRHRNSNHHHLQHRPS